MIDNNSNFGIAIIGQLGVGVNSDALCGRAATNHHHGLISQNMLVVYFISSLCG
jgi:hypothetical protein